MPFVTFPAGITHIIPTTAATPKLI